MPRRSPAFHKNRFGHVLVIAGGAGMGGAAALASMATLRTGAGLVSVATHENHVSSVLALAPEAMVHGIVEPTRQMQRLLERATCVVAGPGLGSSTWAGDMIRLSLECGKPLVLDADGLNLIARNGWSVPQHSLLTPHPGEAARLLNTSLKSVDADRPRAAAELSARHTSTVVLKGAGTLVADSGRLHGVCPVACPALATAGSGDVLAGIAGAALAQGLAPASAASLGVWLHAQAGLLCHRSSEGRAVIARDIIDGIRPWERPA